MQEQSNDHPSVPQESAASAGTEVLISLATTRYRLWFEDEFSSQLEDPVRPLNLSLLGWSHTLLDYRITTTRTGIRKRIEIYRQVSAEFAHLDMLSPSNLEVLKKTTVQSIESAKYGYIGYINRKFAAAGTISPTAAQALKGRAERTFDAECLGVINAAINDLRAEAAVRAWRRPSEKESGSSNQPSLTAPPDHHLPPNATCVVFERPLQISSTGDHVTFRKEGQIWTLSFGGKTVRITDVVSLGYISELLRKSRIAIEAEQLAGASVGPMKLSALPGIPLDDDTAIKTVGADLGKKEAELGGHQERDWTRKGALQEDASRLEHYLGEVETHPGHTRKVVRGSTVTASADTAKALEPDLERLLQGKEFVRIATAARYLGRTPGHVERLVREGKLKRIGEGRPTQVSTASLRRRKGSQ